jgi:hypothetical protein
MTKWPKLTGPNAGGPRQFPIRTLLTARVGQFGRSLRRDVASTTSERGVVSDSALPFAAGILWEQAFVGRRKPLPRVWSLPDNVVNLGASIRGDARIGWYGQTS